VSVPDLITVYAANTPIFKGSFGVSKGKNSVQFIEPIQRPDYLQK